MGRQRDPRRLEDRRKDVEVLDLPGRVGARRYAGVSRLRLAGRAGVGKDAGRHDGAVNALDDWVAEVAAALGLDPSAVDVAAVLDLARDADLRIPDRECRRRRQA